MSTTLYHMVNEAQELYAAIIEADGELTPEVETQLANLMEVQVPAKVQGYCQVIVQLEAEGEMFGAEAARLTKAKQFREASAKRMKERLRDAMILLDVPKIKTQLFTAAVQKNSTPSVDVGDLSPLMLPEAYRKVTIEIDKSKLADVFKANAALPPEEQTPLPEGVKVGYGKHLRIR